MVDAAAAVKATTTASRIRNKFCVLDEIRDMASETAEWKYQSHVVSDPRQRRRSMSSVAVFTQAGRQVVLFLSFGM